MARRILLRINYAGKEHIVEVPADLSIGRLAGVVGQALAPVEVADGVVRYELCLSGVPLVENERVGRVCASLQAGQALQLRIVRERTQQASPEISIAFKGQFRSAVWALGHRAIAIAGEAGVHLWDVELHRWHAQPVVNLPVFQIASCENRLLCALKQGGLALWEFDDAAQRWYGRSSTRLPGDASISSIALVPAAAAVGTRQGALYWLSMPDLELENETKPRQSSVILLHWMDTQYCLRLDADGMVGVWRLNEVKPVFEEQLTKSVHAVGALTVATADTNWVLILLTSPMQWIWVTVGAIRSSLAKPEPSSEPVSLAYGTRSRTVWVGFADGVVHSWQMSEVGQLLNLQRRYTLGFTRLRQIMLSRDERWLVSIDEDNQVRMHSIQELQAV